MVHVNPEASEQMGIDKAPSLISGLLLVFLRSKFGAADALQCRQIGLRQFPQDSRGDIFVIVAQYVANSGNLLPRNFRIACLQVIREMTAGFGYNLNTALDEPFPLPILFECFERHIYQDAINAFNRLDDVRQSRDDRTCRH